MGEGVRKRLGSEVQGGEREVRKVKGGEIGEKKEEERERNEENKTTNH